MTGFSVFLGFVLIIGIFGFFVVGPRPLSDEAYTMAANASWEEIKERIDHQISVQRAPMPNTWFFRWITKTKFEIEYQYYMPLGRPPSFKLRAEYRDGMIHYDFDGDAIGFRKDVEKERYEARLRALIS